VRENKTAQKEAAKIVPEMVGMMRRASVQMEVTFQNRRRVEKAVVDKEAAETAAHKNETAKEEANKKVLEMTVMMKRASMQMQLFFLNNQRAEKAVVETEVVEKEAHEKKTAKKKQAEIVSEIMVMMKRASVQMEMTCLNSRRAKKAADKKETA